MAFVEGGEFDGWGWVDCGVHLDIQNYIHNIAQISAVLSNVRIIYL